MENPWKLLETVPSPRVGETVGRRRTKTQGRMDSPRFVLTEDKQKSLMNYSHKLSFTSVTRYIFVKQVRLLVRSEDNNFSYPHDLFPFTSRFCYCALFVSRPVVFGFLFITTKQRPRQFPRQHSTNSVKFKSYLLHLLRRRYFSFDHKSNEQKRTGYFCDRSAGSYFVVAALRCIF